MAEAIYAAPFYNEKSSSPGDGMEKSYQEIQKVLQIMNKTNDVLLSGDLTSFWNVLKNPFCLTRFVT